MALDYAGSVGDYLTDNPWKNLWEVVGQSGRKYAESSSRFDASDLQRFIEGARQFGEGISLFPLAFAATLAQGGWSAAPLDDYLSPSGIYLRSSQ